MKKHILSIALVAALILSLTGCSMIDQLMGNTGGDASGDSSLYTGRIGQTMKSYFFDFTVDSVTVNTEGFGSVVPAAGHKFVVVTVTVHNTFGDSLPMFAYDFDMSVDDGENWFYSVDYAGLDGQFEDEFQLANKDTYTGFLLFEVESSVSSAIFAYIEYFDNDTFGDDFQIPITFQAA